jgi:hypothetical protein
VSTVSRQMTMLAVAPTVGMTQALFRYDGSDPYAVTVVFGDGAVWAFDRELLARGQREAAGLGDVRIWPEGNRLRVMLSSDGASSDDDWLLLSVDAEQVRAFLRATYRLVPAGREDAHLDVDLMIGRLLDGVL